MDLTEAQTKADQITPYSLKDAPSLIEKLLPAQKISAEAQKERKAGPGQTLTALGSYWKGRKPLILNKACILGALLPATDDPEADLSIFEKLMAIDDEALKRRAKSVRHAATINDLPYLERLDLAYRPEEIAEDELYSSIWEDVNTHLGTDAHSFPELIEQLGIMRFGHRPRVADTFSGSGQIPFEAARLGCDVYASDLNPIACMLTWGALNIVGASAETRKQIEQTQNDIAKAVDREVSDLKIEHDSRGNRAKAYLYCLETRCPQTGWIVPMLPTRVVSISGNVYAELLPNPINKRFDIEIIANATDETMRAAQKGTIQGDSLVYTLEGEEYRTPIKTLRGDYRRPDSTNSNRLRHWDKEDFKPRQDDVFQERLYAIQWISADTLNKSRQKTFFASVREEDLEREWKVELIVRKNLAQWQAEGIVPDMPIEPGEKTDEPIRTRGWTYWHHLFSARQLLLLSIFQKNSLHDSGVSHASNQIYLCAALNFSSKLCRFDPSGGNVGRSPKINNVFDNQALNTLYNWGERASIYLFSIEILSNSTPLKEDVKCEIESRSSDSLQKINDYYITDPPYADAINYHEITEFFIAWLRKNPPELFNNWIWDSRRVLAIKGSGEDFRRNMVAAYRAMADYMPDNGLQVVMFTHQDASVWADMAAIMWGGGLQVSAAWYIATETTSELKKGGYVQGTVLLVLRKRLVEQSAYRDELVQEVRTEVESQIDTLVGLNQSTRGNGRTENLFEDADLQMAGYAAALRVLTGYTNIDGQNMTAEALRPRLKGEKGLVGEIIDFAVQVANEHLVPEGITPAIWEKLTGSERFYLKMMELETIGLMKLDNYQNFAKAFRVGTYTSLMASIKANAARLKTGFEFKKSEFDGEFGSSGLRGVLFALYELQKEVDSDEVMGHLRDMIAGYHSHREHLKVLVRYIAAKREKTAPQEAEAARILLGRIQNERLSG
jgi:adenine-specific DNA methylase